MTTRTTISLPPKLHELVEKIAQEQRISFSQAVAIALIKTYVKTSKIR